MPYTPQPNAILELGGLKATGVLTLEPAAGFHVHLKGGAVGSFWSDTRATGALTSDYSQFRMTRAGVPKWRMGNNILGLGNDEFVIRRDAEGALTDLDVMKIARTDGRVDFAGQVYSAGTLLGSGGTDASALSTGTVPVARLGASGTRDATTYLRGDNTWAVVSSGGGGGMPTTGGSFTGDVFFRNAANTMNTISLFQEGAITLQTELTGSVNGAPCVQFRVPTEDTPFELFHARLGVTGDRGIRFDYNYREPIVGGISHGRSDQFQQQTGMEQDGAIFWRYNKPATLAAGTYDVGGKSLALYTGGFTQDVGPSTGNALRSVDICGMQAGRVIRIGASSVAASPIFSAEFDNNGTVSILKHLALPIPEADKAPIRFNPGTAPNTASLANGDMYFDGTDMKIKVAGAMKTFTLT